jgi:hypothetical protein
MSDRRISRRALLRGLGGAAIALPLLESMACERSAATQALRSGSQASPVAAPIKRFIAILNNNGRVAADFYPTGDETNFALGPIMQPLEPYASDLVIFQGIDNKAALLGATAGHYEGAVSMLTGFGISGDSAEYGAGQGVSLDQKIAKALGGALKRPSMVFATDPKGGNFNSLSWDEHNQVIPKLSSPMEIFRQLFADAALTSEALAAQLARRQSILDGVQSDFTRLLGKISGDDAIRVQAHLDAIRQVEAKLPIEVSCKPPSTPYPEGDNDDKLPDMIRSQIDLFILALSCDISRVATFSFRHPGAGQSYHPWLGLPGDSANVLVNEHHEMSHDDMRQRDKLRTIATWYMEQTAYLVSRLKEVRDGAGTLFDGTVIFQGSECADGPEHTKTNMPYFLVGSAGGAFKTGRFLKYDGASHNDLLVSLLNAFDIAETTFGDPSVCSGPLARFV